MSLFVFIGSHCEVHGTKYPMKLTRYGERVDLPEELAESTVEEGGMICIPAEEFDRIFTAADQSVLKKFPHPASHANLPPDIQEKKGRAIQVLLKGREEYSAELAKKAAEAAAAEPALAEENDQE